MSDLNRSLLILQEKNGIKTVKVDLRGAQVAISAGLIEEDEVSPSTSRATAKASQEEYTYKTDLELRPGDVVVVMARGRLTCGVVRKVDRVVDVSFDGPLSWVVANVTDRLAKIKKLIDGEETARHRLMNARVYREAKEYMASLGVDENDGEIRQLLGMAPQGVVDDAEVIEKPESFEDMRNRTYGAATGS